MTCHEWIPNGSLDNRTRQRGLFDVGDTQRSVAMVSVPMVGLRVG